MSNENKNWTPGPWRADGALGQDCPNATICVWPDAVKSGDVSEMVCIISEVDRLTSDDVANAHLIAAAPEMYEALERLYKELITVAPESIPALQQAKKVMAKARGENQ